MWHLATVHMKRNVGSLMSEISSLPLNPPVFTFLITVVKLSLQIKLLFYAFIQNSIACNHCGKIPLVAQKAKKKI